jgi:hypothetical protein
MLFCPCPLKHAYCIISSIGSSEDYVGQWPFLTQSDRRLLTGSLPPSRIAKKPIHMDSYFHSSPFLPNNTHCYHAHHYLPARVQCTGLSKEERPLITASDHPLLSVCRKWFGRRVLAADSNEYTMKKMVEEEEEEEEEEELGWWLSIDRPPCFF